MAKLSSSCFILVLLLLAAGEGGLCKTGEPFRCVTSWDCVNEDTCKKDCSTKYPQGFGSCTGNPIACLCLYNCPP